MAELFPPLTPEDVLAFQFSSWYPRFKHVSIRSMVIRPLGEDFKRYLLLDGVRIPEGSDDALNESDALHSDSDDSGEQLERFAFPGIDSKIRKAIADYKAVFPKLNFSSPKDASWILPSSSPLKCTSPSEVYMLLKSSDFISHDVESESVFDSCFLAEGSDLPPYELELVLRKWHHVDPSREFRCFARSGKLFAITQRDRNFYSYMNELETREIIQATIMNLWKREIEKVWTTDNYIFDVILTRDLKSGHIVDFNPYAPRTDPLLFSYDELLNFFSEAPTVPLLKIIDSAAHKAAAQNAPANFHNMVPFEMLSMSYGQTIDAFQRDWEQEIQRSMKDED